MNEREESDALDQAAAEQASRERSRPRVMIGDQDVTEHVVTILDALSSSMDWGSGFLNREDLVAWKVLAEKLAFDKTRIEGVERQIQEDIEFEKRMLNWSSSRRYW